jgi:RimJ/RimL family protein N-acetyltransferase
MILAPAERQAAPRPFALHCPVIETPRLLLRPPHATDIDDIVALANNYKVASMLASMPHPYFAADAREFLERRRADADKGCVHAITLKENGEFVGICGLHEEPARYSLPFLGYWIGEPHWGCGYASEAARALVDLYFKATDRAELLVSCRRDNPASRRVIEKCGGRFWKTGQSFNRALGQIHQLEHWLVDRERWIARAGKRD